jgi:hypothetical protein
LVVVVLLFAAGALLTWLGSADPPINPGEAFWRRTLQQLPGVVDRCGDFTWMARVIPPLLAGSGAAVANFRRPRSAVTLIVSMLGWAVTISLAVAATQNAIPWGEQRCIID